MARRRRNEEDIISLFPFLSILACVIGTLTMMIAALALGQVTPASEPKTAAEEAEAEKRLQTLRQLQERTAKDRERAEQLRHQVTAAEALRQDPDRLAQLRQKNMLKQFSEKDQGKVADTIAEVDQFKESITLLNSRIEMAEAELDEQKKEFQRRNDPQAKVSIITGGSGKNLKPTFVECAEDRIVLHDGQEPVPVPKDRIRNHPGLEQLLERVKKDPRATVVFLIRETGIDTYYAARREADEAEARHGKLPIAGQGEIDLTFFRKPN